MPEPPLAVITAATCSMFYPPARSVTMRYNAPMRIEGRHSRKTTGGSRNRKAFRGRVVTGISILAVVVTSLFIASYAIGFWQIPGKRAHDEADVGTDMECAEAILDCNVADAEATQEELRQARVLDDVPTRIIAMYGDIEIRSPITKTDITCILFHQASYPWGLVMTTQLEDADAGQVEADHSIRINREQTEGEWLDADALHIYRSGESTEMDTSVDVGGAATSPVYAPVTGTVVLIRDYMLYDEVPDIEIHIQPDGHPELDCVVLHTTGPLVTAGDHVTAGSTQISVVRDIACQLDGIQLATYTGEMGNHAHVQMNYADYEGYRERLLPGAIVPGP